MTTPSAEPQVSAERRGCAVWIELRRPERANAYTQNMLDALSGHIDAADADRDVRAIVITGAGDRAFSAGADRDELKARHWRDVQNLKSAHTFERLRQSRCVSIAAINGAAVGGGLELAAACDLRVAVSSARFWLPEPEFGLLPAAGGIRLLPHIIGEAHTKALILGGAVWDANDAHRVGLLTEVVAPGELASRVQIWIDRISKRDANALRLAKAGIERAIGGHSDMALDLLAQSELVKNLREPSSSD